MLKHYFLRQSIASDLQDFIHLNKYLSWYLETNSPTKLKIKNNFKHVYSSYIRTFNRKNKIGRSYLRYGYMQSNRLKMHSLNPCYVENNRNSPNQPTNQPTYKNTKLNSALIQKSVIQVLIRSFEWKCNNQSLII